jgi:cobalt-zinc-cadmium efflux system outer membrane protein
MYRLLLIALYLSGSSYTAAAQAPATDTVRYRMQEAEKVFLQNNLPLLAGKLNISQADAHILQAKAWPNPTLSLGDVQLYNNASTDPSPPLFGNFWRNRTFTAQLEQLVYTAGKRRKNINLQTTNKALAEQSFTEMLQSLKAEFRQTEAELLYLQEVQGDQQYQLSVVNELVRAQQGQLREGNISQSEMYRIKALQISLQSDINSTHEDITEKQEQLKNLMAIDPKAYLVLEDDTTVSTLVAKMKQHPLDDLLSLSTTHNAGIQTAATEKKVNEASLVVERANRVPDVTFNAGYDRNGNNQLNFVGLGASMDLPVFNRNKGNIKVAQLEVQKSDLMYQNKVKEVNNAVVKAWTDLHQAIVLYESIDQDYLEKLDALMGGVSRNFMHRDISLLEFLDLFSSFRSSKEQYYTAIKNINLKKETLNYLTGTEL